MLNINFEGGDEFFYLIHKFTECVSYTIISLKNIFHWVLKTEANSFAMNEESFYFPLCYSSSVPINYIKSPCKQWETLTNLDIYRNNKIVSSSIPTALCASNRYLPFCSFILRSPLNDPYNIHSLERSTSLVPISSFPYTSYG